MRWMLTALGVAAMTVAVACDRASIDSTSMAAAPTTSSSSKVEKIVKSNEEWKKILPAETYHVMREQGTERPFANKYHDNHAKGTYICAACDLELYSSETKFDSGTGWPSFWKPVEGHVALVADKDGSRTEVECARCGGHLGHVFDDGPKPTGLRYCMNSAAMKFVEAK
jgi:peptide-methionine (R)-S-oxide reductase